MWNCKILGCGFCISTKPAFNDAAIKLDKKDAQMVAVDCTQNNGKFLG